MGVKTNVSRTTLAPARQPAPRPAALARSRPPRTEVRCWVRVRDAVTNLLFPPQCVFCADEFELAPGELLLCAQCRENLDSAVIRCPACALPAPSVAAADGRCATCRQSPPAFAEARVLGSYQGDMRQAVLKIKHVWYEPLATTLGRLLAERIEQMPLPARPDWIVPVPMHWWRRLVRGTSAAETLAEMLSRRLSIPLAKSLVRCRRLTERQSTLPVSERRENVRGAYAVSSACDIKGATILVVDDVITTAATCDEVARILKRAGAERVFAAAVARAGT
ncbi:MAG TPA: ComF family protein [Pirellulaceae bacterium]|nr:ComF family protein [Pirellulaceae bacterium]